MVGAVKFHDMTEEEQSAYMGLIDAQAMCHRTALNAGWHTDIDTGRPKERNFGEAVALMHSELSEALEAHRKSLADQHLPNRSGVEVEFADCIIRILDLAGLMDLDLAGALIDKNRFNRDREDHKLAARKAGGKAY